MIDLAAAKAHLRIDAGDTAEDSTVTIYLAAAQAAVQSQTSKLLTSQQVTMTLDGFPGYDRYCGGSWRGGPWHAGQSVNEAIRLLKGPVTAIVSIAYDDQDGVEQTLTSFRLVEGPNARLLPAYGEHWPSDAQRAPGSVRIAYQAGYDDAGELYPLPPELDQAVLFLVGHYYANREAVIADNRAAAIELPVAVEALLANYTSPGIA